MIRSAPSQKLCEQIGAGNVLGWDVKSGYTSHTNPALFVSRITPVPEFCYLLTVWGEVRRLQHSASPLSGYPRGIRSLTLSLLLLELGAAAETDSPASKLVPGHHHRSLFAGRETSM